MTPNQATLEAMWAGRDKARAARTATKRQHIIQDTRNAYPRCRCELTATTDLRALGGGCTMPNHACPRLDAVRRRFANLSGETEPAARDGQGE